MGLFDKGKKKSDQSSQQRLRPEVERRREERDRMLEGRQGTSYRQSTESPFSSVEGEEAEERGHSFRPTSSPAEKPFHSVEGAEFKQPGGKKKKGLLGKILKGFLIVFLLILLITGGRLLAWQQQNRSKPVIGADQGNSNRPIKKEALFLVAGLDDTGKGKPQRSDTLMLVKVSFDDHKIVAISLPRDSRVMVNGKPDKLNHAYAYGGVEESMETIRNWLSIDLDYYVQLDYKAVVSLIDAGGGVVYDVPEDLTPKDWETFKLGRHRLDGTESLSYLRHRKSYKMGDIGRVHAQQAFVKEAIKQMSRRFYRWPFLAFSAADHIDSNLPVFSVSLKSLFSGAVLKPVEWHTIPGEGKYIHRVSYYVPNEAKTRQLVEEELSEFMIQ